VFLVRNVVDISTGVAEIHLDGMDSNARKVEAKHPPYT
jgi:hypothetical protein